MHDHIHRVQAASQGFLTRVQVQPSHVPGFVLLAGRFDLDRFVPDLFDGLGILCPATLQAANPRRQAEFLAGRAIARMALETVGVPYADMPIMPDRRPQWPSGVTGSISHARGHMASLVGVGQAVHAGLDVETIAQGQALAAIERMVLLPSERALLAQLPQPDAARVATLIFSGKEALFKALFPMVGRVFGFDAAALVAIPDGRFMTLRLTGDLTPALCCDMQFSLHWQADADRVMTWLVTADDRRGQVPQ